LSTGEVVDPLKSRVKTPGIAQGAAGLPAGAGDRGTGSHHMVARRGEDAAAAQTREARLDGALRAGRLGYWELDLATRSLVSSDLHRANWGRSVAEDFTYDALLQSIHPDDRSDHERAVQQAITTGDALDIEQRAIWPDRSVHWLRVRAQVIYDKNRAPLRLQGISSDITDRKQGEHSLHAATRTLDILNRLTSSLAHLDLEQIVQAVTDAATELSGAQFGALFYHALDDRGDSYLLYALSGTPRDAFSEFPMPRNTELFEATLRGTENIRSDDIRQDPRYRNNAPDHDMPAGRRPVASYLAIPLISRSREVLGGIILGHAQVGVFTEHEEQIISAVAAQAAAAIDNVRLSQAVQSELAERRRAEDQLTRLLAELNHRVKNTLAIVQSIAGQTLRHSDSAEAFRSGFEARIMALSEAHNLLTESNWNGASLHDIAECVLRQYGGQDRQPYSLSRRDIRVGTQTAVSLVMAFHELATNAAKYGALSNSGGRITVDWMVDNRFSPPLLQIDWRESGGPQVAAPTRRGFGWRLIRNISQETGKDLVLDFAPSGLICSFAVPLWTEKVS
jgi:two-component sensor histidine kinase